MDQSQFARRNMSTPCGSSFIASPSDRNILLYSSRILFSWFPVLLGILEGHSTDALCPRQGPIPAPLGLHRLCCDCPTQSN